MPASNEAAGMGGGKKTAAAERGTAAAPKTRTSVAMRKVREE
jgi:hypothetical protein